MMIHFFIQHLIHIICKQIIYQFDAATLDIDYWVSNTSQTSLNPFFSQCNGQYILGGYAVFDTNKALMRFFELPPHYEVQIDLTFYSWDSDLFRTYLDQRLVFQQAYDSINGSNLCGDSSYNDEIISISLEAMHNNNFAVVYLQMFDVNNDNNVNQNYFQETWGLKQFALSIEPCPLGCYYCETNSYQNCKQWQLQFFDQSVSFNAYVYYNFNQYQLLYCDQLCQYIITYPYINKVMIRFRYFLWDYQSLSFQIALNNQFVAVQSIVNNLSFAQFYEVSLIWNFHSQSSFDVKIQRTGGSYWALLIKDFQILIENQDEQQTFLQGCDLIIQDSCWECQKGWILEQASSDQIILVSQFKQQCIPYCGDSLIVGSEQCDDGNQNPYDGCYECKFQCEVNCIECSFGVCQECRIGYQLNQICEPICGDGLLIPYTEQCEDFNTIQGVVKCNNCQWKCTDNCIECLSNVCLSCSIGFQLLFNACDPLCGDHIKLPEYEDCDDGNDEQYDGCYNCKYQCKKTCQNCIKGVCMDCQDGEININNECVSQCGNSIVTGSEQCDDGNNIQYDGCYQCQFSCPLNCMNCESGVCNECEQEFNLNNQKCQSVSVCGNGLIRDQEECDDGNTLPNDGCATTCQIEDNWYCIGSSFSYCVFQDAPVMILTLLNYSSDIQFVKLSFSQEVKTSFSNNLQVLNAHISNIVYESYTITVFPTNNLTNNLSNLVYLFEIQIHQAMSEQPTLTVSIDENIVNQYDMKVIQTTKNLKLRSPNYLSPLQKQQAASAAKINEKVIYCLAAISLISLVAQESNIFSDILNTLQYVSYLKFLNIDFPENLLIFLNFRIQYQLILFQVSFIQIFIIVCCKLLEINRMDLVNFQYITWRLTQQKTQWFVILFVMFQIINRLLYTNSKVARFNYCTSYLASKMNKDFIFFMTQQIYKLLSFIIKSSRFLTIQLLVKILLMNEWDLLFKAFLYLSTIEKSPQLQYIQLSLSITIILTYLIIFLFQYSNTSQSRGYKDKLSTILEGKILLMKQTTILFYLVFYQENQIIQTLSILIINLAYIILLHSIKTHFNQRKSFVQFFIEIMVILFILASIVHFDDFKNYIDPQIKILIGFVQIGMLGASISSLLIEFAWKKFKSLLTLIKRRVTLDVKPVKTPEVLSL